MRRSGLWLGFTVMLFVAMLGCDTGTDVTEVTVQGNWEGVGAMQTTFADARMDLTQDSDGTVSGSWRRQNFTGSVSGSNQSGNLQLTLHNFSQGAVVFEGRFRDGFTMEGSLNGTVLEGNAVFRRKHF